MSSARCAVGVASSFERHRLFAFGGYNNSSSSHEHLSSSYLDTAEALDLSAASDARWAPLPPMAARP